MERQKRYIGEEIIYWTVLLGIGVLFLLFYKKFLLTNYDNVYHRIFSEKLFDMSLEEMVAIDANIPVHAITYPLYHFTLKVAAVVCGRSYEWGSYVLLTAMNILSMALFRELILLIHRTEKITERILIDFLSISAIFFVVARSPLTDGRFYSIQCAANPVHNPTVLFVRPFGIVAFISFVLLFFRRENNMKHGTELAIFSVSMFLSILSKPNFAFAFLPAMGLVTLIYMIQKKSMKLGLQLLGAVAPSLILLIVQFAYLSLSTSAMGLQVVFGGFTGLKPAEVFSVSLATFPAVIILFSLKEFKNNLFYRTAILALAAGWLQMFFLTNGPSGDFSWGYDLAVQFATVVSIACSMKSTTGKARKYAGYIAYAYQVFCGVQYIILVNNYGEFLI